MGETESHYSCLLSLNKALSTRIGLHLIWLLDKEVPWEFPNNLGCGQDCGLLSTNCYQGPIGEDNTDSMSKTCKGRGGTELVGVTNQ